MITFGRCIAVLLIISITIYTMSYGTWTWRANNHLGAIMVYVIAIAALVLPMCALFLVGR